MVLSVKEFQEFISIKILSVGGQDLTVGQLLVIPVAVLLGYLLLSWLVHFVTGQMHRRKMDANLIQVVRRVFYILGLIILAITTLDFLNVL